MLTLILILLVTLVSLTVILWAGTFLLQGYIYTEPTPGIFWQAPLTALLLTLGYSVWCMSVALSTGATTTNLPINAIHRFTPHEDMLDRPAARIWAIQLDRKKDADKEGIRIPYVSKREDRTRFHYENAIIPKKLWSGQDVVAIEIELDDKGNPGEKRVMRFNLIDSNVDEYRQFRSDDGWIIREYRDTGPTGMPVRFRLTRLLMNLFFNVAHFVVWFVSLWLILRFQAGHAFGLALVLWLIVTVTFLPMMLFYAGEAAEQRQQIRTATVDVNRKKSEPHWQAEVVSPHQPRG